LRLMDLPLVAPAAAGGWSWCQGV